MRARVNKKIFPKSLTMITFPVERRFIQLGGYDNDLLVVPKHCVSYSNIHPDR